MITEMATLNSAVTFSQQSGTKKSYLEFLDQLIDDILLHHSPGERSQAFTGRQQSVLRLLERQFPAKTPPTEKQSNSTRQCHICSFKIDDDGGKVRRESRYFCTDCNVALCVALCFRKFHRMSNPAASSEEDVYSSESEAEDMYKFFLIKGSIWKKHSFLMILFLQSSLRLS